MYDIYHDIYVKSDKVKTFKAIVTPEDLINWWPKKCSGDACLHGEYNFFFTPEYDWKGKVITYKENESFHVKMTTADEDWDPTTFGFDLNPDKNGVWIQFWHKDWPELNHHFRRSSYCWALLLQGLKEYIESGKIIDFDQRA
jgi:hypothetical protein